MGDRRPDIAESLIEKQRHRSGEYDAEGLGPDVVWRGCANIKAFPLSTVCASPQSVGGGSRLQAVIFLDGLGMCPGMQVLFEYIGQSGGRAWLSLCAPEQIQGDVRVFWSLISS